MKKILLRIAMDNTVLFIGAGVFIHRCITKKKLLEGLDDLEDKILKIAVIIAMAYLAVKFVTPSILDVPYCIRGDFCIVEGTAQHNDYGSRSDREVRVLDAENHQTVRVVFPYKPGIREGDRIRVQYVPHSGYGRLLEINGEKVHEIE